MSELKGFKSNKFILKQYFKYLSQKFIISPFPVQVLLILTAFLQMSNFVFITFMHFMQFKCSKLLFTWKTYSQTFPNKVISKIGQQTCYGGQYGEQKHWQGCNQIIIDPIDIAVVVTKNKEFIQKQCLINRINLLTYLKHYKQGL